MHSLDIQNLRIEGDVLIERAKEENNKAREDVVPHLICSSTRQAIENYLQAYLLQNDRSFGSNDTIDQLFMACINHNAAFREIPISLMECRGETKEGCFCTSPEKLEECINLALNIRAFSSH